MWCNDFARHLGHRSGLVVHVRPGRKTACVEDPHRDSQPDEVVVQPCCPRPSRHKAADGGARIGGIIGLCNSSL